MEGGWLVVVTEKGSGYKEIVRLEDGVGWTAVAEAGVEAMTRSANGSAEVALMKDCKLVRALFPKCSRDLDRKKWAMVDVVTTLQREVRELDSLEAATKGKG